jgi:hypothetical protein
MMKNTKLKNQTYFSNSTPSILFFEKIKYPVKRYKKRWSKFYISENFYKYYKKFFFKKKLKCKSFKIYIKKKKIKKKKKKNKI